VLLVWVWSETQLGIVLLQDSESQTVAVGMYLFFSRFVAKGIALGGSFR
jgi:hypothetical protein